MNKRVKMFPKGAFFILFCIMIALLTTSCIGIIRSNGTGELEIEERTISGIDSISIGSGMDLYVEQTGSETLKIEAEDNVLPLIINEISNGKLILRYQRTFFRFIITRKPVKIYLTVKDLNEIKISSGANLKSGLIQTENLKIDSGSGAKGEIEIDVDDLHCSLSGGADLMVKGTAARQDINVGSGATYDGEDLISSNVRVNVSSGSVATIHADEILETTISSGGTVRYHGAPQITSNITSGGNLESLSKD